MKLAVEFPSVSYREGGEAVLRLAEAIEEIGYDQLDMFDHVVMAHPAEDRGPPVYPPRMPILEALMALAFIAARTRRIGLGTEVLVLPQRQPVLAAKQIASLDTISGGRVRLGAGVGWQQSEYEALGAAFQDRGARLDEAIALLRACWRDARIDFEGRFYRVHAMAMEPKPPQGAALPIWIGGSAERALERVGRLGDGWLAIGMHEGRAVQRALETIRRAAEEAGRDPAQLGYQMMLGSPPRDEAGKRFYAELDRVVRRAGEIRAMGFDSATVNATAIFQAGARSVDAMIDVLGRLHERIRAEVA